MHQPQRWQIMEQALFEAGGGVGYGADDATAAAEGTQALQLLRERALVAGKVVGAERNVALAAGFRVNQPPASKQRRRVALAWTDDAYRRHREPPRDQVRQRRLVHLRLRQEIREHDGDPRRALLAQSG